MFPHLITAANVPKLVKTGDVDWDGVDAAFCCLPHATTQVCKDCSARLVSCPSFSAGHWRPLTWWSSQWPKCMSRISELVTHAERGVCSLLIGSNNDRAPAQEIISQLPRHIKVVDLSADFRLKDINTYAEWCAAIQTRLDSLSHAGRRGSRLRTTRH